MRTTSLFGFCGVWLLQSLVVVATRGIVASSVACACGCMVQPLSFIGQISLNFLYFVELLILLPLYFEEIWVEKNGIWFGEEDWDFGGGEKSFFGRRRKIKGEKKEGIKWKIKIYTLFNHSLFDLTTIPLFMLICWSCAYFPLVFNC